MNTEYLEITNEDIDYIEDMAIAYNITREQALERFITGNIDGIELTDEDYEILEKLKLAKK